MKESSYEAKLVSGVGARDGLAIKFTSSGMSGVPDRLILMPGGKIYFAEYKTPVGELSPLQAEVHRMIRQLGFDVYVPSCHTDTEKLLKIIDRDQELIEK